MKRFILTTLILFLTAGFSFAESFNSDLYLYCHNTGSDQYKYDVMMKQALIVNDLQLNNEQKKQIEVIFNTYGSDYAELQGSLSENKEIYSKMKKDKTSFSTKSEQRKKIRDLKKEIKKLQKSMIKETKKILTHKQRSKYNTLIKNVF